MSRTLFQVGEWVEVRSKEEILRTLDNHGRLDELPFMPEMFQFCGRKFRVHKRAHKTCDSVNKTGARRMLSTVHLEGTRCDGAAHGGCEAACFLFWKEAWLRPVAEHSNGRGSELKSPAGCTEDQVWAGSRLEGPNDPDPTFICQATKVPDATLPLRQSDPRQYIEDFTSGNTSLWRIFSSFCFLAYRFFINLGVGLGRPLRFLYDLFQRMVGGVPYPCRSGVIPVGSRTPAEDLNLQPGEWVRVRSYAEILQTLDRYNFNRGMLYTQEMVPYCGQIFQVRQRVNRIINEKTGKLMTFKTPCIILDGVECEARYVGRQLFCPRATYHYWREIWLERVPAPSPAGTLAPVSLHAVKSK